MNFPLYQIIVPLFCLVMIAKAFSHFLRKDKTMRELVAWFIFWGLIASASLFPEITSYLSSVLGIKSNVNAVVFSTLGILSYLCFKLMVQVENQEHQITKLTREIALREEKE